MVKNNPLRELARSEYWQNSYRTSKELNIDLFKNKSDLTKIQIIFLSYLSFYENLNQDLAMNEDYISKEIIADDVRSDAYIVYKRNKNDKKEERPNNNTGIPSISFIPGNKRK